MTKLRLQIDVEYDLNGETAEALLKKLSLADMAPIRALLGNRTPAKVQDWSYRVFPVREFPQHDPTLRSCADLLLEAYAKGEVRESVDWEDVDLAHEAAIRELPQRHDELDKLYAELDEDDEDEDEDEEICPACEASVDLSEAESCRVDGQDGYICPSCGTRVPLGD
jgi:predicted RNA-binding Zn-ribbon protein involved in translation (DUF1610 family)